MWFDLASQMIYSNAPLGHQYFETHKTTAHICRLMLRRGRSGSAVGNWSSLRSGSDTFAEGLSLLTHNALDSCKYAANNEVDDMPMPLRAVDSERAHFDRLSA